jgi:uncharacterized RDD family membrane protein YckC
MSATTGRPMVDAHDLGQRTRAGWIDVLLLFVVSVIISLVSGQGHIGSWTSTDGFGGTTHHSGVSLHLNGVAFVAWIVISLLYYFISELTTGQTIGKRLMGLTVVTVDGRPLGAGPVLLRTLGRIVDVLPAFYLIGWFAMHAAHQPPQRLGDRLAGTTVVSAASAPGG